MAKSDKKEKIEELLRPLEKKIEHYHIIMDSYIKKLHGLGDYIKRYYEVDKEMNELSTPLYEEKDYSVRLDEVSFDNMDEYINLDAEMFDYILIFKNYSGTVMLMIDINKQTFLDNVSSKGLLLQLLNFDIEKAIIDKLEEFRKEYL